MYKQLTNELLAMIDISTAQQYAEANGWTSVEGIRGNIRVYRRDDADSSEIAIPGAKEFADYTRRMVEAVEAFAEFEARSPSEILTDLLMPRSDILKIGLRAKDTQNGTVSLDEGIDFFEGAKTALLSSACAVVNPLKFYKRLYSKNADKFISSCRLGQTEYGSYVTTIICPLDMDIEKEAGKELALEQADDSFPRQTTKRFITFANRLIQAIEHNATDRIVDATSIQDLLSANFCEALTKMEPQDPESTLNINVFWNNSFPLVQQNLLTPVVIKKEYFPVIKRIAQDLRPSNEPVAARFIGKVVSLEGVQDEEGRMNGNITFQFFHGDEVLRAKVFLTPVDYEKACDAHRDNAEVVLNGELHIKKRMHVIESYTGFGKPQEAN